MTVTSSYFHIFKTPTVHYIIVFAYTHKSLKGLIHLLIVLLLQTCLSLCLSVRRFFAITYTVELKSDISFVA